MATNARLLLVDDDALALDKCAKSLGAAGYDITAEADLTRAIARIQRGEGFELAVLELGSDPMARLQSLRGAAPRMGIVCTTSRSSMEAAVQALRGGALDYLSKPLDGGDLLHAVKRAIAKLDAEATDDGARVQEAHGGGRFEFEELVGGNPRMQRVYSLIRTVAPAGSTVLVTGESGTGKERVAAAIHRRSSRCDGPFVRVNCSAFAEGVLESELFGHEQGAFTGAHRARSGVFRRADGGTLFLDEVADLPAATQVKLLRVIQEREVQPVGGDNAVPVDVRLIAATNRDLAEEVRRGSFREDLYFRLNVIPLHIPALRERPDDIPHLVEHFLAQFAEKTGKPVRGFTERAMAALERYPWPGNVRELENAVERAVVLAADEIIDMHDLPSEVRGTGSGFDGSFQVNTVRLAEVEEIVIRRVLTKNSWNIKRSAEMLGITRATLYSKIRKFGLAAVRD